jgi:hypothetical protein
MAAGETEPEMKPAATDLEAFLAAGRSVRRYRTDLIQM